MAEYRVFDIEMDLSEGSKLLAFTEAEVETESGIEKEISKAGYVDAGKIATARASAEASATSASASAKTAEENATKAETAAASIDYTEVDKRVAIMQELETSVTEGAETALKAVESASLSAENALVSETNAKVSEDNSKLSEDAAKASEQSAVSAEEGVKEAVVQVSGAKCTVVKDDEHFTTSRRYIGGRIVRERVSVTSTDGTFSVTDGYLSGGIFYYDSAHTNPIAGTPGGLYCDITGSRELYVYRNNVYTPVTDTGALEDDIQAEARVRASADATLTTAISTETANRKAEAITNHVAKLAEGTTDHKAIAGIHNSIYRGKNLGTSITTAQYAAISGGTFDDMYVGDYWVHGGNTWYIAGFDYICNTTTPHVIIVLGTPIEEALMNTTSTTSTVVTGYSNSVVRSSCLVAGTTHDAVVSFAGSSHILSFNCRATSGISSSTSLTMSIELMTEVMVYGTMWCNCLLMEGNYNLRYTILKSQLPLFRYRTDLQNIDDSYWLQDIVSQNSYAIADFGGNPGYLYMGSNAGVRPFFALK